MTRSNSFPDLGARLRAGEEAVLEVILRTHGPPILTLLKQRFVGPLTTRISKMFWPQRCFGCGSIVRGLIRSWHRSACGSFGLPRTSLEMS